MSRLGYLKFQISLALLSWWVFFHGHLNDQHFYKRLINNIDRYPLNKINKLTNSYKNELIKKEWDYFTKFEAKTSNFYRFLKIDKLREIKDYLKDTQTSYIKIPNASDLKWRLEPNTQKLSNLLCTILKPLCKLDTSFIRDVMHFLNHIPEKVNKETNLGREAVEFWNHKNTHKEFKKDYPRISYLNGYSQY